MKKWMALGAAIVMTLSLATAYAAVPSKTTSDITTVGAITVSNEAAADSGFAMAVTEDKAPVVEEILKVYEAVVTKGTAPVKYFPTEVQETIAAKAEGVDTTKMEMNEFISVNVENYEESFGDALVDFTFATVYKPGQKVVAVVGIYTGARDADGNYIVEWIPVDAEVNEDGSVKIFFPDDCLAKMQEGSAVSLAILSE